MKKVLLALLVAISASSWALWQLGRSQPKSAALPLVPTADSSVRPVAAAPPAAPRPNEVREQIFANVERERPRLKTVRDLAGYLGELEATARRNHRVSALEVEPGLQAIQALQSELGGVDEMLKRQMEFSQRMAQLSAELDGPDRKPPADLDQLARRIERARGDEREQLIRSYSQAMAALPAEDHLQAATRLNQLVHD